MTADLPIEPTWLVVSKLFSEPYWAADTPEGRSKIGGSWIKMMTEFGIRLDDPGDVTTNAVTIYDHLRSRAMPITADPRQYWPDWALEILRLWVNQGCRVSPSDPLKPADRIPYPQDPEIQVRVRRDIRSLSPAELDDYRSRVENRLRAPDPTPQSPWQINSYIHTDWCLHYQEAFLLWHRASLLHYERLIGAPIPYWNIMAEDAVVDRSPDAGIPEAFRAETYVHPRTGQVRPNPLRYAAAKGGKSKACASANPPDPSPDCRWVQRDPVFYTSGDDHRAEREKKYAMVRIFQQQIVDALKWKVFSTPESPTGYPWANITVFNPPQPDYLYPHRTDFDGLLEQPHDNWHGWVGFDMADNAYTAFDPLFWSYHAAIDRILETWLRAHPSALFTANFPLQPFAGAEVEKIVWSSPEKFLYTTIGDMARDSRALGYDYGPPMAKEYDGQKPKVFLTHAAALNAGIVAPLAVLSADGEAVESVPAGTYVVFTGVRCTADSFLIDIYLDEAGTPEGSADVADARFAGRFTRLGMGVADDKGRCICHSVTRVVDVTSAAARLNLKPGTAVLRQVVTDITKSRVIPAAEYADWPGFEGRLVWGSPWPGDSASQAPGSSSSEGSVSPSCCHAE